MEANNEEQYEEENDEDEGYPRWVRLRPLDVRVGEEPNKSRKCRRCRIPLYPSEGIKQLCPWCYDAGEEGLEPYDQLTEQLALDEAESKAAAKLELTGEI